MPKGNTEQNLYMVLEIEKYPELYDKTNIRYKNIAHKLELWKKIGAKFHIKGDLREKFNILKSTHKRAMKAGRPRLNDLHFAMERIISCEFKYTDEDTVTDNCISEHAGSPTPRIGSISDRASPIGTVSEHPCTPPPKRARKCPTPVPEDINWNMEISAPIDPLDVEERPKKGSAMAALCYQVASRLTFEEEMEMQSWLSTAIYHYLRKKKFANNH